MEHLSKDLGATQIQLERLGLKGDFEVLPRENQDYIDKINELHSHLDMVKKMVKPGCSEELLKVALSYMASLVNLLSVMSLTEKLHASL